MSASTPPLLRDPSAPEPASTASFTWSDARLLGYAPMDETHQEFYQVAFRLLTCDEATVEAALLDFQRHALDHFEQEDQWMRSTDFPPRDCHIEEHAAVLKSVDDVLAQVRAGQAGPALAQDLAMHLFAWFPGHADYLDSALAAWMSKRAHGGKPIVLRRGAALR